MPSRATRAAYDDEGMSGALSRLLAPLHWAMNHARNRPADSLALASGGIITILIVANALYRQSGTHPAPIFAVKPKPVAIAEMTGALAPVLPRPRPNNLDLVKSDLPETRARTELIADIQRELAKRGFYDGSVDGVIGPKTDAAIRDFEQSIGRKPTGETSDAMHRLMLRTPVKVTTVPAQGQNTPKPEPSNPGPAPSKRVIAAQRALADFGYGQIKPTGLLDAPTKTAIERFERERRLPITGDLSDRVVRELAAITGRPLE